VIEDIGDTEFLPEEVVDKFRSRGKQSVIEAGGRPATVKPILLVSRSFALDGFFISARASRRRRACSPKPLSTARWIISRLKENVIMAA